MFNEQSHVLHVAALPFKTPQGTQAAVEAMAHGTRKVPNTKSHLLTYGFGQPVRRPTFYHHKLRNFPPIDNMRSGPSFGKIALDIQITPKIRSLNAKYGFDFLIAHHVEAAMAAWMSRVKPWAFFAHTALGPELPTYFPGLPLQMKQLLSMSGQQLDAFLVRKSDIALAISPRLAQTLETISERQVRFIPLPWDVPASMSEDEKKKARADLEIDSRAKVILYAGNLDAYQGWEKLLEVFERTKKHVSNLIFLFVTASNATPLQLMLSNQGLQSSSKILKLDGSEEQRRKIHAICDVVLIPRESPGGLPIKLIDALCRGVPVVCSKVATAGLSIEDCAQVVVDNDVEQISHALVQVLEKKQLSRLLQIEGPKFIQSEHSQTRFIDAISEIIDGFHR